MIKPCNSFQFKWLDGKRENKQFYQYYFYQYYHQFVIYTMSLIFSSDLCQSCCVSLVSPSSFSYLSVFLSFPLLLCCASSRTLLLFAFFRFVLFSCLILASYARLFLPFLLLLLPYISFHNLIFFIPPFLISPFSAYIFIYL